jgi:hypothetical protein
MSQFVTLEEAKRLAKELGNIGGGVLPYNEYDSELSGIYVPEYIGPFATPEQGEKKFFHFRFRNGASGFNAGLVKRTMEYSPTRWPVMIATEVNAGR